MLVDAVRVHWAVRTRNGTAVIEEAGMDVALRAATLT
jgi:hypothetical protein